MRLRSIVWFTGAFLLTAVALMLPVLVGGSGVLRAFWHDTIAYQSARGSPFSIWGLWGGLGVVHHLVQGAAVALALAVAVVPRRRGLVEVAALGAAVLIALQLGVDHWFYLYIPWFFPLVMAAVLCAQPGGGGGLDGGAPPGEPDAVRAPLMAGGRRLAVAP
ncbi:MAG: hypothetical protein JO179_06695 [Solirubrobacterales bacterium]|nr:hypothetical protein [Solirubrobacterales bacterium]